MHSAGHCVERCVVLTGAFREFAGRGGEHVPETIQIDSFSAGNETFHVRTAEAKVPQQWILQDLIPRTNARYRCVDRHEVRHAIAVDRCESKTDHVADVVSDQLDSLNLERVEYAGKIGCLVLLVEATAGFG